MNAPDPLFQAIDKIMTGAEQRMPKPAPDRPIVLELTVREALLAQEAIETGLDAMTQQLDDEEGEDGYNSAAHRRLDHTVGVLKRLREARHAFTEADNGRAVEDAQAARDERSAV
jgi:hypothetical protein